MIYERLDCNNRASRNFQHSVFNLEEYPEEKRPRMPGIWWQFVIIQILAGVLWLGMFIMALKYRREEKETEEIIEQ